MLLFLGMPACMPWSARSTAAYVISLPPRTSPFLFCTHACAPSRVSHLPFVVRAGTHPPRTQSKDTGREAEYKKKKKKAVHMKKKKKRQKRPTPTNPGPGKRRGLATHASADRPTNSQSKQKTKKKKRTPSISKIDKQASATPARI